MADVLGQMVAQHGDVDLKKFSMLYCINDIQLIFYTNHPTPCIKIMVLFRGLHDM